CVTRVSRLQVDPWEELPDMQASLPGLTEDTEAELLGVRGELSALDSKMLESTASDRALLSNLTPLQRYFLIFWSMSKKVPLDDCISELKTHRHKWEGRFNNYKHAILYTLRRGKRGIRKYYAGWDVFVQLSANNIRYLLELVDQSLIFHLQSGAKLSSPV